MILFSSISQLRLAPVAVAIRSEKNSQSKLTVQANATSEAALELENNRNRSQSVDHADFSGDDYDSTQWKSPIDVIACAGES